MRLTAAAAAPAGPARATADAEHAPQQAAQEREDRDEDRELAGPGERPQMQVEDQQPGGQGRDGQGEYTETVVAVPAPARPGPRPGCSLPGPLPAPAGHPGDRQRRGRRAGVRQVVGEVIQVPLRLGGEDRVDALVELFQAQPALRVVLAQDVRGRFALRVSDAKVRSRCHVILRLPGRRALPNSKTIYLVAPLGNWMGNYMATGSGKLLRGRAAAIS